MSPILSIALLDIETLELSGVSIRLSPKLNSVSLLTEATQDTSSASTAILAVLNKVTSNNLIFRSFDYFLQPILSEVKAYFSRVIPVEPPPDLAFLSAEIPLVYLLKGLNDSVASFSILSDIEVYKDITSHVAGTSEEEARILLKSLNTDTASTLSYPALEALLKREDVALTLSELSTVVNYNRPEFSNTQPSIASASEYFEYLRPNNYSSTLGFLDSTDVTRVLALLDDTLKLESLRPSFILSLNSIEPDLFVSKAGRSHGGNWLGVGPQFNFLPSNKEEIEVIEDILSAKAMLNYLELKVEESRNTIDYLSFTNPLAFAGYSPLGVYTWALDNKRERQESRVDLRAERREKNWNSVGPQFNFLPNNKEEIEVVEDVLSAKAMLNYLELKVEESRNTIDYLSFTNPLAFAGYTPNTQNRVYSWTLDNTKERQESRVDLRAERREKNWDSVGPQFDFLPHKKEEIEVIEDILSAKAMLNYLELKVEESRNRIDYLSFTNPLAFTGFVEYSLDRRYTWELDNTRERQESRVDLRAERREKTWNSVGPQFDFLPGYYDNAKTISKILVNRIVDAFEKINLKVMEPASKVYLSFTKPLTFIGYKENTQNRVYTWELNNKRERQESRVDLRAERREKNWRSVGPQFDFLPDYYDNAKVTSVDLSGKAHIKTDLLEGIDTHKKLLGIKFVNPLAFTGFRENSLDRVHTWELDNTRERQESRVDLRAERREYNWQGVGLVMSVPLRLPEQLINFEEFALSAKAHYAPEVVQTQASIGKDMDISFIFPTAQDRLEQQITVSLKTGLFLQKRLTLELLLDSIFSLYRVPIFTQPIAVTQEISALDILLRKSDEEVTLNTLKVTLLQSKRLTLELLLDSIFSLHRVPIFTQPIAVTQEISALDILLRKSDEKVTLNVNNYLDLKKDTFEVVDFISDTLTARPVYSASISDVSEHLQLVPNNNYTEALEALENFYIQTNKTLTDTVEADATVSGFAQDYSHAYFSQAYVGIAFIGE